MNKKFSTLAVAAMLASAFTAYAGPGDVVTKLAEGNNGKQYQLRAYFGESAEDHGFLYLKEDDSTGDFKLSFTEDLSDVKTLGASLWCVNATVENQGKNPIFDFINKGKSAVLDVTVGDYKTWSDEENPEFYISKTQAKVGGEIAGWEFTPVLGSDAVPMFGVPAGTKAETIKDDAKVVPYGLNSYIDSEWVATLVYDGTAIKVAVVPATDIKAGRASWGSKDEYKQVKFFLQEADALDLTADQFNTILGTQEASAVKLSFDKDYNNTEIVNLFSTNWLKAAPAEVKVVCDDPKDDPKCDLNEDHNFVYLYKTSATDGKTKNYLRVDTAYANGYGSKFLTFAFGKDNADPKNEEIIPLQYKFRLNYCPTDDSLSIQVHSALYKLQNDSKPWRTLVSANGDNSAPGYAGGLKEGESGYGEGNKDFVVIRWNDPVSATDVNPSGLDHHVTNWVKLQDLETATESRIITLGDAPINTHISFGFGGCNVQSEYTSVADGVYIIKNSKGQVLASPIYKNGSEALFVSVDEQDPQHMPAYQWVVLTNYTQPNSLSTSPVKITNREFTLLEAASIQLRQAEGAKYMYTNSSIATNISLTSKDSLTFVKVADEFVKDPYLGYKKIEKDSLLAHRYTFNYWHPYADDKFIAKSSKDSTLTVLEGKDAFTIDTLDYDLDKNQVPTVDIKYGYAFDKDEEGMAELRKRIPELAQLVRTVYVVESGRMNDANAIPWKVNTNDQFNLGSNWSNKKNAAGQEAYNDFRYYFFFKENNHVNGKHYYALVKANRFDADKKQYDTQEELRLNTNATNEFIIEPFKAGVSDYDAAATLKNQVLEETRTSSFAIEPDNAPLYRRFNSTLEGQAGDGVDTLRFYEKYRGEYLMIEANPSFMVDHIDFLGINAQDKAKGGLAFIVDTAWVNRGAGNIKPQYLISIDRHDYQGVAGEPCTEAGPHIDESGHITDDPMECVHAHKAVPGFKRGKFLINFHDFASDKDMVNSDKYKWAEYDRAGFKEAIVVKDTLYILRDEFKNLKNEEIDLAKIASAEVEARIAHVKKYGNADKFHTYRYELTGDNHKHVTWSMRFFDRSVAANEVEADRAFMFESMKSLDINTHDKNGKYEVGDGLGDIAPEQAAWLKMQNGCLVLSDGNSKFNEVVTGSDDALIFNVEHVCGDKVAVDNENIAVEGVSVVAGNGQVTIMGAAGKNVTITNILGKVIASQVIASDNATIAVPAGIVAVAVEGEAAVKAIVK